MQNEIPLKLIELSDFLRFPSIISKNIYFKELNDEYLSRDLSNENATKQKSNQQMNNKSNEKELIIPSDIIIFGDEIDRKKVGLLNKTKNHFSKNLLITSGAALQALIPSLINANQWIIIFKVKYSKLYTKQTPIQATVVLSLNINHPIVRYEILTAFDLLRQSFNETKSAHIVINFSQILKRWFKNYLKQTDQYPNLPNRFLFRYQMQTNKCLIKLGQRQFQDNDRNRFSITIQKLKTDALMSILIDFNSLPTTVYSIQMNNIFVYSMNNKNEQILKDMGDGLSLISVQNTSSIENNNEKEKISLEIVKRDECVVKDKSMIKRQNEINIFPLTFEPSEQEKRLFEHILSNRIKIQMQHQQLMNRAAQLLSFPAIQNQQLNNNSTDDNINL